MRVQGALRALLLYSNPFLHRGMASDDFHEVLAHQVGDACMRAVTHLPASRMHSANI